MAPISAQIVAAAFFKPCAATRFVLLESARRGVQPRTRCPKPLL